MKNNKFIEGILPAIFSVYDEDLNVIRGTVDKLVNYQLQGGVKGFYVGGNTGECTVLPAKTRKQMLETVLEANAGRGKVIAHVGAGHFDEVMDLLQHANDCGVDAIASLPPSLQAYYEADEIVEYYKILAEKSKVPVYAYVTGVLNCDLVTFAQQMAEIDNIVGLKISISNYYAMERVVRFCGDKLNILNGPDETLTSGLIIGADGAIGTTYNMLPKLTIAIYDAVKNGDVSKARQLQNKLNDLIDIALPGNIAYWKAIMTCMGFDMGYTVQPQRLVSPTELKDLETKLQGVGFFDLL